MDNEKYIIKTAREEDLGEIKKCLNLNNYNESEFTELNRQLVFAAFDIENGGLCAVIIISRERNLISIPAVKKEYIGNGLTAALIQKSVEHLRNNKAASIKSHVAVESDKPQNLIEEEEFLPVGFLLGAKNKQKEFLKSNLRSDKRTLAVYAKTNLKKSCGEIFIPLHIREAAEKVYGGLGIKYTLKGTEKAAGESIVCARYDRQNKVFYAKAEKCGTDLKRKLSFLTEICDESPLNTIILYLNIKNRSAVYGFGEAEELGFIFSGFDPLDKKNEYIIMSYIKGVNIFTDEIKTTAKSGAILLDIFKNL